MSPITTVREISRLSVSQGRNIAAWIAAVACFAGLAIIAPMATADAETILYRDTFDRANNATDLNASTAGKTGTWGPLTWGRSVFGTNPVLDINANNVRFENGTGAAAQMGGSPI